MKHSTYCSFPFESIAPKSWLHGKPNRVTPCCNMKTESEDPMGVQPLIDQDATLLDIFMSKKFDILRQDLLSGIRNKACDYCWNLEDRTGASPRLTAIKSLSFEKAPVTPKLRKIDTMIDENCNLRCRTCAPSVSNSLRQDYHNILQLDLPLPEYYNTKQEESKIDTSGTQTFFAPNKNYIQEIINLESEIQEFKFTGGEPTTSKSFWEIINNIKNPKEIKLHLTTNATKFNTQFLDIVAKFKQRHFTLSIDGTRSTYEYIRFPANWRKIESNIDKLCSTQSFATTEIHVCSVLNIYNMLNLRNLVDWIIQHNWYSDHKIKWKCIPDPHPTNSCLDVKWASKELLDISWKQFTACECDEHVQDAVQKTINYLQWCSAQEFNNKKLQERRNRLKQDTITLDRVRNQSYDNMLHPLVAHYITHI
jgi:organic radical activating enzyme